LDKLNTLLQEKLINVTSPFDEIVKIESAKIPLRVYSMPELQNLDPSDVFSFCNAFIRYGAAVAIVLFEILEQRDIEIKSPPYSRSHIESELIKRCPCSWLFIKSVLDIVIDTQAENFILKKPWVENSIDLIKERIIKEFVYEGFSIGLESAGY
jgi:hypothetical protein